MAHWRLHYCKACSVYSTHTHYVTLDSPAPSEPQTSGKVFGTTPKPRCGFRPFAELRWGLLETHHIADHYNHMDGFLQCEAIARRKPAAWRGSFRLFPMRSWFQAT